MPCSKKWKSNLWRTSGGGLISDTSTSRKKCSISSKENNMLRYVVFRYVIYIQDKADDMLWNSWCVQGNTQNKDHNVYVFWSTCDYYNILLWERGWDLRSTVGYCCFDCNISWYISMSVARGYDNKAFAVFSSLNYIFLFQSLIVFFGV